MNVRTLGYRVTHAIPTRSDNSSLKLGGRFDTHFLNNYILQMLKQELYEQFLMSYTLQSSYT